MGKKIEWHPFSVILTNDDDIESVASPVFNKFGEVFTTPNAEVVSQLCPKKKIDILIIDEALFLDKTVKKSHRESLYKVYVAALKSNSKMICIILFDKKNSNFLNEFERKSEVAIRLDRSKISCAKLCYIVQMFSRQMFRGILLKDVEVDSVYTVPLYDIDDSDLSYDVFLKPGEKFSESKINLLMNMGMNRIYVETTDLLKVFEDNTCRYSEEYHVIRKRYKLFLSYFLDASKDDKTFYGKKIYELGIDIIERIKNLTKSCANDYEAIREFLNPRWSGISHGLNTVLLAVVFGRYLNIEDLDEFAFGALVHDHGKFEINISPDSHGKFFQSIEEQINYKKHPEVCFELIDRKRIALKPHIRESILDHHEHFDGTGFPKGKSKKEISKYTGILALSVLFDHLYTVHIHNGHTTLEQAWTKLLDVHNSSLLEQRFDPELLKNMEKFFTDFIKKAA